MISNLSRYDNAAVTGMSRSHVREEYRYRHWECKIKQCEATRYSGSCKAGILNTSRLDAGYGGWEDEQ